MSAPVVIGFDYSILEPAIASRVRDAAERIRTRMRDSVIEIGTALIEVREGMERKPFLDWLTAEFGMSERSADNHMNAARLAKGRTANFANAQPSVLYMLAAPSVPEPVRERLLTAVDNGEQMTVKKVKEEIAEARYQDAQRARAAEEERRRQALTPSQRKARQTRRTKDEAERQKWTIEMAARAEAGRELANLIRQKIGDDKRLSEMLKATTGAELFGALTDALKPQARDPAVAQLMSEQRGTINQCRFGELSEVQQNELDRLDRYLRVQRSPLSERDAATLQSIAEMVGGAA